MISVRPFQILAVLSLVLGFLNQHRASESCAQATRVEKALTKRATGGLSEGVDDLARASTDAAERLDDELTDTKQTYRAASSQGIANDHDGQRPAPAITKVQLSMTRKAEIAESLASHQEEISEMRTEWQGITTLFESLKHRKEELMNLEGLRMHIEADLTKTIDDILEELTIFNSYVLHLVQNRLRELGGLRGLVIGTKKKEEEESYIHEGLGSPKSNRETNEIEKEDENFQYSREKTPQSTYALGHSALHIVLRENIMAQKKRLEKSDVLVTTRDDPTFDKTMREVHQGPGDLISDELKAEKLQELNNILHTFTFSSSEFPSSSEHEVTRLQKSAFAFIFTILQFMYKFEMINKDHLRRFFKAHETQEVMVEHLSDLLKVNWRVNLIPDMSLITRHWHTQHLHKVLTALDENQIKLITHTILGETVMSFIFSRWSSVRYPATVYDFFPAKTFLPRLEKLESIYLTRSKNSNSQLLELMNQLKAVFAYFQNPIPKNSECQDKNSQTIDYLITFCFLKFIIEHYPKVFENCFSSNEECEVFEHQFSLIQAGLYLHQQINQILDDRFSFQVHYVKHYSIPESVVKRRTDSIKLEINNLVKNFNEIRGKVVKISEENSEVNQWIHETSISGGIIEFLTQRASFIQADPELISDINKDQYRNSFLI